MAKISSDTLLLVAKHGHLENGTYVYNDKVLSLGDEFDFVIGTKRGERFRSPLAVDGFDKVARVNNHIYSVTLRMKNYALTRCSVADLRYQLSWIGLVEEDGMDMLIHVCNDNDNRDKIIDTLNTNASIMSGTIMNYLYTGHIIKIYTPARYTQKIIDCLNDDKGFYIGCTDPHDDLLKIVVTGMSQNAILLKKSDSTMEITISLSKLPRKDSDTNYATLNFEFKVDNIVENIKVLTSLEFSNIPAYIGYYTKMDIIRPRKEC